ncbi:hypothetical protein D0U04_16615 [Bacillus clarus]|uniref:Phage capsid protein n=1 Tax=Bacillus clarus TaxID=2338372 RepID=A0A090YZC0_9BACI|nr:DUF6366 family protein [Bacillus clarus]KFN04329.1 hypothetical protein DJ93_2673 [Bacillus clarus]RFT65984.1 hypothetical protein D0U04_16615 [Bacillus clarus]
MASKETPKKTRERLRQKELKNNATGSLQDGLNRSEKGSLVDLAGGMGWKGTGVLILLLVVGYIIYSYIFN